MASTRDNIKSVKVDSLNLWADPDGVIYLTTDDADVRAFTISISNKPTSTSYHPKAYAQFARILRQFGKNVSGWVDEAETS